MPRARISVRIRRRLLTLAAIVATVAASVATAAAPVQAASGTTYYVNCAAATNGSGTQSSPWNTTASVNTVSDFQPGDQILFERGTTCSGSLAPQGSGSSAAPITIGAYGTGALPLIAAGSSATAAVQLTDQSYWTIQDLQITGGVDYGVYVTGTTANATLTGIDLTDLDVSHATGTTTVRGDSGEVYVYPRGTQEVISNVVINGVTAHDANVGEGIFVGGAFGAFPPGTSVPGPGGTPIGQNITIENSTAYSVAGDGILMTMVQNGTIQNSVAHNSGACSSCGSTPSGLWEWYCQTCTLQFNESYSNHTWGTSDGGAFDIDNYNSNNTLQYNYGHDNDGYCLAVFGDHGFTPVNDVFRYNVCSDNERKSNSGSYEMSLWPTTSTNLQIYNNTFYFNPANGHAFLQGDQSGAGGLFKNNIVYSTQANLLDTHSNGFHFDNNIYYVAGGDTPTFTRNGTAYSGLSAYQAASGEDWHSLTSNPLLNNPTYDSVGTSLTSDTLQAGSPALSAGVNICQGIANCSMGTRDYFGDPITTAGAHTIGAQDLAAALSPPNNTGFESGCSGWDCYGGATATTGNARTGNDAVVMPGGSSSGAEQTVTGLAPNTRYRLQGFAKTSVAGQCVYIGVKNYGGTETQTCVNSTAYSAGTVTFTTGPTDTSALIYFWNPAIDTSTGYGDDVTLSRVPAAPNYGAIQNSASGTCLDITGNSQTAGTLAEIWTCNSGPNQIFTRTSANALQVYGGSATMCVDDLNSSTASGATVAIWGCGSGANQQWLFNSDGTVTTPAAPGLCLGLSGSQTGDGTKVQLLTCDGSASQKWSRS